MTQQYLAGELSSLLGELQAVARNSPSTHVVAELRREAETLPLTALPSVAEQALRAANAICWDALIRGDTGAFVREVAICVDLWQFAVCAGLVEDKSDA